MGRESWPHANGMWTSWQTNFSGNAVALQLSGNKFYADHGFHPWLSNATAPQLRQRLYRNQDSNSTADRLFILGCPRAGAADCCVLFASRFRHGPLVLQVNKKRKLGYASEIGPTRQWLPSSMDTNKDFPHVDSK